MERIAETFILRAIQEWGQSESERVAAVQAVIDAAGLKATATCWPVFGGIWPKPCTGPDGERATEWLRTLTETMRRGRFQDEVAHVCAALAHARAPGCSDRDGSARNKVGE